MNTENTGRYVRQRTVLIGVQAQDRFRCSFLLFWAPEVVGSATATPLPNFFFSHCSTPTHERNAVMLYTIAVVLVVLWLLGLVTATTMGGFIHILLVIAIIAILLRVISGRSPL